jgi:hypothetical protein
VSALFLPLPLGERAGMSGLRLTASAMNAATATWRPSAFFPVKTAKAANS